MVGGHVTIPNHDQIAVWEGDQTALMRKLRANNSELPVNCRGLILSRWLDHKIITPLVNSARKRRVVIFNGLSDTKIRELVKEITMPEQVAATHSTVSVSQHKIQLPKKGRLQEFLVAEHRTEGLISDEGRRLFVIAKERGIVTTEQSIIQAVGKYRRACGLGSKKLKPKQPQPKPQTSPVSSALPELLVLLDQAVTSISLVMEELKKMVIIPQEKYDAFQRLSALVKEF